MLIVFQQGTQKRTSWRGPLAAGNLYTGLSLLMRHGSAGAKKGFLTFFKDHVRAEVQTLTSPGTPSVLRSDGTIKSLRQLKFESFQKQAKATTPLLWNALVGAATTQKQETQLQCQKTDVKPHIMAVVSMLCYARKPQTMKALQQSLGVQLWYAGAKREVCYNYNSFPYIS